MNSLEDRLRAALAAKSDAVTLDGTDSRAQAGPATRTGSAARTGSAGRTAIPTEVIRLVADQPSPRTQRVPSLLAAAAAVVFALVVSAVGAGWGHRPALGHPSPQAEVPWSQVGPDWRLTVTTATASDVNGTLYLLDPSGQRYQICLLPASFRQLEHWSFDTGRALVTGDSATDTNAGQVLLVNLRTGSQVKL